MRIARVPYFGKRPVGMQDTSDCQRDIQETAFK